MSKSTEKSGEPASPHHEFEVPPSYYEAAQHLSQTQPEDARHHLVETQYAAPSINEQQTVRQQQAQGPPGDQPPPAYTDQYGTLDISEGGMDTKAVLTDDGRISINISQNASHRLSSILTPALHSQWKKIQKENEIALGASYAVPEFAKDIPPINILIQIIGSRGDVQPFIALGKVLKEQHGHRVRVATHPTFKGFVEEHGLEFFSLGGDPSELMAFMVKNPGLVPGIDSLRAGDVSQRRKGMWEMLLGGWRACIEPGDGMGYRPAIELGSDGPAALPFVADAIIANPPSFGHIHCAEKLGIPLHLMFTMPWSPTTAFPHPLANIRSSNVEPNLANFLSYSLVDMLTWQGLGDLVNNFREGTLGLEPVSTMWAPGMMSRLRVPHTYCWSPTLIPKPDDWPRHIKISGFYFLSLASSYTPPPDLERFLNAGPPPVYIGFGSIVVDDPNELTKTVFEAVRMAGCRALVSQGWGGIGGDDLNVPENIMLLGNCPHDWLFPKCAAVVHHGGAGTTAAGIRCGKATVIVPFFGDQPFWGSMIARAGAGACIPSKELTSEKLAGAITMALSREVQAKAEAMGDSIRSETGSVNGANSFLASVEEMGLGRCDLLPKRVAVWTVKGTNIKLSALAATILVEANIIDHGFKGLRLFRHKEWRVDKGPTDPITGGAGAILGTMGSVMMGVGDFPREIFKAISKKDKGKEQSSTPGTPIQENRSTESFATAGTSKTNDTVLSPTSISRTGSHSTGTDKGKEKQGQGSGLDMASALTGSKAVSKIVGATLRSPLDFSLGLAQGFRNAPTLYGDEVRPEGRVTGFHSGLKTAGKELGLGFYDGITGLVTQPVKGAKEEGAVGALKGFGRGIGGLILKPGAGIYGIPAYTMKGIHREIVKLSTKDVDGYVESARAAQGAHELLGERPEIRRQVVERWAELRSATGGKRTNRWRAWSSSTNHSRPGSSDSAGKKKLVDIRTYDDAASDENLQRALRESVASASSSSISKPSQTTYGDYNEKKELERALRDSLGPYQGDRAGGPSKAAMADEERDLYNDPWQNTPPPPLPPRTPSGHGLVHGGHQGSAAVAEQDDEAEQISRAIAESLAMEEERNKRLERERVVMEYVAEASLQEEELRRRRVGGAGA